MSACKASYRIKRSGPILVGPTCYHNNRNIRLTIRAQSQCLIFMKEQEMQVTYLISSIKILPYIFRFSIFVGQSLKQKQLIGHSFVEMGQFLIKLIQFVIFLKHLFHAVRQNPFMAQSSLVLQTTKIIIKSDFIIFIEEGTFCQTPYKTCHTCLQLSNHSFWIFQQLGRYHLSKPPPQFSLSKSQIPPYSYLCLLVVIS